MHLSYILQPKVIKHVCVERGNYYPSRIDKEMEAQRGPLSKSVAELRFKPRPSTNSTSFPITPPQLSSKSSGGIRLGAMVWVVFPPIPEGLRRSFTGDPGGELCIPTMDTEFMYPGSKQLLSCSDRLEIVKSWDPPYCSFFSWIQVRKLKTRITGSHSSEFPGRTLFLTSYDFFTHPTSPGY